MSPGILIISGPPGAGKTTVGARLARSSDLGVHLVGDQMHYSILVGGKDREYHEANAENRTVCRALAAAAAEFADGGYFVSLDWIVGPWFLGEFKQAAAVKGVRLDYVMLRLPADVAASRAAGRAERPIVNYESQMPLYRQLADIGDLEGHVIEVADRSVEDVLALIRRGMALGSFRLR